MSLDQAKQIAQEKRPELFGAKLRVEAAKTLYASAWDQHLPSFLSTGNYTWSGFDLNLAGRWTAGVTLSVPVFQGFALSAQVEQAQTAVDIAESNLTLLQSSVMLDVEQQYLNIEETQEGIKATEKLVDQATQNLFLVERQYAAGVGSPLEVTDAQLTLTNAKITRTQALYDYSCALARLNRAIGVAGEMQQK